MLNRIKFSLALYGALAWPCVAIFTIYAMNGWPCDQVSKALCQRCHLRYDAKHHARNSSATRMSRKAVGDLFAAAQAQKGG